MGNDDSRAFIMYDDVRSILVTKTFWLNVALLVSALAGLLPSKYGVPIAALANIVMRRFSSGEVTITGKP